MDTRLPGRWLIMSILLLPIYGVSAAGIRDHDPTEGTGPEPDCRRLDPQSGMAAATYAIPGATPFWNDGTGSLTCGSTGPESSDINAHILHTSDVALVGTVAEVEWRCVHVDGEGVVSLAILRFDVETGYWGVHGPAVTVEVRANQGRGCVRYDWPRFDDIQPGERYLFIGRYDGPRLEEWGVSGLFRLRGDVLENAAGTSWPRDGILARLEEVANCQSLEAQTASCDLLCRLRITAFDPDDIRALASAEVEEVLFGPDEDRIMLVLGRSSSANSACEYHLSGKPRVGIPYLAWLTREGTHAYELMHGWRSLLVEEGPCLLSERGVLVTSMPEVERFVAERRTTGEAGMLPPRDRTREP